MEYRSRGVRYLPLFNDEKEHCKAANNADIY
jgi:hypothetical protein